MTWTTFHHRGELLRLVTTTADARRDGVLPMDLPGVSETFGDELTLLAALQLRWHTRLAGAIERSLADQPMDLDAAVVGAWGETADNLPGVRLVLDRHRAEPLDDAMAAAMTRAMGNEHMMLAVMAGRSSVGDPTATAVGARLEDAARRRHGALSRIPAAAVPVERPTLLERLRAVVAA